MNYVPARLALPVLFLGAWVTGMDAGKGLLAARPRATLVLLRNAPLAGFPEVTVRTLPAVVRALPGPLRSLYRLGQAVAAVRRHRCDFVHGVHLWPHGLVAWAAT